MNNEIQKLLSFVKFLEGLKKLERFKESIFWSEYPFPERYESVADHSWRMAVMVVVLEKHLSQPIDMAKTLKMALIHDIPEIIAGDPSPLGSDGTGQDSHAYNKQIAKKKFEAEKKAARQIFSKLPTEQSKELYDLWLEFEAQKSFEAKIVKALDKIEGKLQALQYSGGNVFKDHQEFNLTYGVKSYDIDPVIKELGMAVVEEFKKNYKEFTRV